MQGSRPDTDTIDINSRINIDLTDNQSLSLGAQYYKDEQDTNYGPDYGKNYIYGGAPNSYIGKKGLEISNQPLQSAMHSTLNTKIKIFLGQVLNLEGYYRKEDARFFPVFLGGEGTEAKQSQSEIEVAGLRSTVQK